MDKLSFTFDKELFGAFQHGDWRKQAEVEDEINDFLKGIKTVYVDNGVNITSNTGRFFASFDTQHANDDANGDPPYLILNVDEVLDTQNHDLDERTKSSRRRFLIVIDPGNKLTFKKDDDGGIVSVKLDGIEAEKPAPCDQVEAMAKSIVEIAEYLHIPTVAVINLVTAQTERLEAEKECEADD